MRPASAKAKGRRLQTQVASDLCAAFGLPPDDVRSCPSGSHGEDVQLSDAARRLVPWSIECKNQERLNLWAAFEQAEANAAGHTPVVVAKRNRHDALCTMRWSDALALLVAATKRVRTEEPPPPSPSADTRRREVALLRRLADRLEKDSGEEGSAAWFERGSASPSSP